MRSICQAGFLKRPGTVGLLFGLMLLGFKCSAEERTIAQRHAENLTVMVNACFGAEQDVVWGSGIIVGKRASQIYVVTATHVVNGARRVYLGLRWASRAAETVSSFRCDTVPGPNQFVEADVLHSVPGSDGDLTVLKAKLPPGLDPGPDTLLFTAIADRDALHHEDGVRPLGHAQGKAWQTCLEPDTFDKRINDTLAFESKCVDQGDSGGPLLDEDWLLVGVVHVDQQPIGTANEINSVLTRVRQWSDVPVDLETVASPDLNTFEAISAYPSPFVQLAGRLGCGVTTRNRIYCWGNNTHSKLGIGSDDQGLVVDVGVRVADRHRFSTVSVNASRACALSLGGTVFCWGEVGEAAQSKPFAIGGGLRFVSISTGPSHACGITVDGSAYCWGDDRYGQLGNGSLQDHSEPVRVNGNMHWKQIVAGDHGTCAVSTGQQAYCWGSNGGKIFEGQDVRYPAPTAVATNLRFTQMYLYTHVPNGYERDDFACGIEVTGSVYCWGNSYDWLKSSAPSRPVRLPLDFRFTSIALINPRDNGDFMCGSTTDGNVVCWDTPGGWLDVTALKGKKYSGKNIMWQVLDDVRGAKSMTGPCILREDGKVLCLDYQGTGGYRWIGQNAGRYLPVRVSICSATPLEGQLPEWADLGPSVIKDLPIKDLREDLPDPEMEIETTIEKVATAFWSTYGRVKTCEIAPEKSANVAIFKQLAPLEVQFSDLRYEYLGIQGSLLSPNPAPSAAELEAAKAKIAELRVRFGVLWQRYKELAAGLSSAEE